MAAWECCQACQAAVSEGARFCSNCGTPVVRSNWSRTPPAGYSTAGTSISDRRIITVLFTDVTGFTEISEHLDPEEVSNIINGFFEVLIEPIYRFGGVVDKFIGDAVMALFGAPIAHEDDPERAVRAALDMQTAAKDYSAALVARTGISLRIRIGLNTGLVVAGSVGAEQRSDYTVIGDTVNLAARMEANARPEKILVTAQTWSQTRHAFRFEALPPLYVKGKAEPVEVYEVVGPRPRASPVMPLAEVLIGRQSERDELGAYWQVILGGRPKIVLLSGESGLGKSSLVRAFLGEVASAAQVWSTKCLSFEQHTPYAPVGHMLRDILGVPEYAPLALVSSQLRQFLSGFFPDDSAKCKLLEHFLGEGGEAQDVCGLSPKQVRIGAFLALNDLVLAVAANGPLVISVEDLHWADEASLEWLGTLFERLASEESPVPVLIMLQARPGTDLRPMALSDRPGFTTINLGPLAYDTMLNLGASLLGFTPSGLPGPVHRLLATICDRAEGNPHYLGETLRHLLETGSLQRTGATWSIVKSLAEAGLPTSIRSAAAARLDLLGLASRTLLQIAAVIGREFETALVTACLDKPSTPLEFGELERAHILTRLPDGRFAFSQGVFQEVAYENLLLARRRELHGRVGEAMEREFSTEANSQATLLANHFIQAEDLGRACRYSYLAGERARATFSRQEARLWYRSALEWQERFANRQGQVGSPDMPARSRIQLDLAQAETELGNLEAGEDLIESILRVDGPSGEVLLAKGSVLERRGRISEAFEAFQGASNLPADPLIQARAIAALGNIERRLGHYQEAIALSRDAQRTLVAMNQPAEAAVAHGVIGLCLKGMGDADAALREHAEAMRLREQSGDIEGQARSHNNIGIIMAELGQFQEAQHHYTRSLGIFKRLGDRISMAMVLNNLGDLHLKKDDDNLSERHFREALRLAEQLGNAVECLTAWGNLAEVYLRRSEGAQALACMDRCLALMQQSKHGEFAAEIRCTRGRALAQMGSWQQAIAELALARKCAIDAGNIPYQGVVDRALSEIAESRGQRQEALRLVRQAIERLSDSGLQVELARAKALLARIENPVNS